MSSVPGPSALRPGSGQASSGRTESGPARAEPSPVSAEPSSVRAKPDPVRAEPCPVRAELVEALLLQVEIDRLNADYAAALDECRFDDWPLFFTEDASYIVQGRENFDRGLPLALIALESRGMMKDRVYGATQTIYHAPYYTRHVVGPARVLPVRDGDEGGLVRAQAHYAVFRTRPGDASEVYNVGRYIDEIVRTDSGLKFASRRCVYDSEMVLNSLIYPI